MTRKLTVTYELPEELCEVFEQKAAAEGRRLEDVVAEHLSFHRRSPHGLAPREIERRKEAFERHIGAWDSGRTDSSDNDGIDADLARQYDGREPRGG